MSTDEKLGVEALEASLDEGEEELEEPPAALGEDELEELPAALGEEELEAPPEALPEDLLSVALGLVLEPDAPLDEPEAPVLCASATLASANRAAAVAVPTTLTNM